MPHAHCLDDTQIERLQTLRTDFFRLSTLRELHVFRRSLAADSPVDLAFAFLLGSWTWQQEADPDSPFLPHLALAEDLSAGMLGERPIIFMGTNYWAAKPYLSLEYHIEKVTSYANHLKRMREVFRKNKVVLSIIPEKDYVIDKHFLNTGRFQLVDEAMSHLARLCADMEIPMLFNEYLAPLREYETEADLSYFDTHLPGKHYIQIFSRLLSQCGHSWQDIVGAFTMLDNPGYGDLHARFGDVATRPPLPRLPALKAERLAVVAGTPSFGEPLGATWQSISNEAPLLPGKVLVLGDSHSSILAQKRLTYLCAAAFEKSLFYWNPVGVRETPDPTDADFVILETSLRFVL
jgi:hypothetical protein